jgi:hypothetical protein
VGEVKPNEPVKSKVRSEYVLFVVQKLVKKGVLGALIIRLL